MCVVVHSALIIVVRCVLTGACMSVRFVSYQVLVVVHCPAPHYIPSLISAREWTQLADESRNPDASIVVAHIAVRIAVCVFVCVYVCVCVCVCV